MSIDLAILFLAGLGAFAVGYGCVMDKTSSFDDGSFMYQVLLIAGGALALAAAALMAFVVQAT